MMDEIPPIERLAPLDPIRRLTRDVRDAATVLGDDEVRFLVDAYYIQQDDRKRSFAQDRSLREAAEPNSVIRWLAEQSSALEKEIQKALDYYTRGHPMGAWMREVHGIGPVISAGLLAHIDISVCPTVGHIWQFAGIAGSGQKPWEKGTKRPFNAKLKTLCWKLGQSFMKFSNDPKCYYGQHYREQKAVYVAKNEAGGFAEIAIARAPKFNKATVAYAHYIAGKLPPAHIDAMARRWAVKMFLSHLHDAWYRQHFGSPPPAPYPIAHLPGHTHVVNAVGSEPRSRRAPELLSEPMAQREP